MTASWASAGSHFCGDGIIGARPARSFRRVGPAEREGAVDDLGEGLGAVEDVVAVGLAHRAARRPERAREWNGLGRGKPLRNRGDPYGRAAMIVVWNG